jgi:hypothetical protein
VVAVVVLGMLFLVELVVQVVVEMAVLHRLMEVLQLLTQAVAEERVVTMELAVQVITEALAAQEL